VTDPLRFSQALQRRRDQEQRTTGRHLQRLPAGGRRHADHRGEAVRQDLHLRQGTISMPITPPKIDLGLQLVSGSMPITPPKIDLGLQLVSGAMRMLLVVVPF
jgi:hypothetical protein